MLCRFCERIIPVQTTCSWSADGLKAAADNLAAWHAKAAVHAAAGIPIAFAGE